MASGINNTFRQLGIATGIAALGAIFASKVDPRAFAPHPSAAARASFVGGLHDILLVGAGVAAVGAVLAAVLVRRRDFVASGRAPGRRPRRTPRPRPRPACTSLDPREAVVGALELEHVVRELARDARRPTIGSAVPPTSSAWRRSRAAASRPSPGRSSSGVSQMAGSAALGGDAGGARRQRLARSRAARRRRERDRAPRARARAHALGSCERSRNSSQTWITRQPSLDERARSRTPVTGMPPSIAPGSAIAVRAGSPSYS